MNLRSVARNSDHQTTEAAYFLHNIRVYKFRSSLTGNTIHLGSVARTLTTRSQRLLYIVMNKRKSVRERCADKNLAGGGCGVTGSTLWSN
jgi:hypothetical protein